MRRCQHCQSPVWNGVHTCEGTQIEELQLKLKHLLETHYNVCATMDWLIATISQPRNASSTVGELHEACVQQWGDYFDKPRTV